MIGSSAFAEGLEECVNAQAGIRGVAHRSIGYRWEYTHWGKAYYADAAECVDGGGGANTAVNACEKITSIACMGHQLVERFSVRHVKLYDEKHNLVIEADLQCRSKEIPHGLCGGALPANICEGDQTEYLNKSVCVK